jgi:hypothetical protein
MSDTSFGGITGSQAAGAGVLGLGALGIGSMIAQGPGNLPPAFQELTANVPGLEAQGAQTYGQGQSLVEQGQSALSMAQAGQLTPEQQAQVQTYGTGLTNQARQMYSNMGVNPDQDTSFLSTTANIDTQVNAMAQQQIQSTIQLGLGELSGGNSLISEGLGFENAANQALLQAGQAQIQQDQQYSSSLTGAFGAIGSLFGSVVGKNGIGSLFGSAGGAAASGGSDVVDALGEAALVGL